jgi:hypothetical protein
MNAQEKIRRAYMVTVRPWDDTTYRVYYVPRGLTHERGPNGSPKTVPRYSAMAQLQDDEIRVRWEKLPPDPEAAQADFDQDVRARIKALREWIGRLTPLVTSVRGWAEELGWATRNVDKPMKEAEIGDFPAPGLLLQRDMTRVGLDPIGSATPGTGGVVELYLLPAYDDIASLYYYDDRWNLHYMKQEKSSAANIWDAESKPLTKKALQDVLEQLTKNG